MGYRCRWLATRTSDRADVLKRSGFEVTAELTEEVYDPGLYAVDVDGWLVVVGDGWDFKDALEPALAARLSDRGEVIFVCTDDSPMCADVASFTLGTAAWSLSYDGSNGVSEPKIAGNLPDAAQGALATAREQQRVAGGAEAGVDHIYDAVAEIGRALVGFRHDQTLADGKYLPIFQLKIVAA